MSDLFRRPLALVIAAVATLLLFAAAPARAQDPVIDYETSDPAMSAAIAEARRTLPSFLAAMKAGGNSGFSVKVAIPHAGGREHIWMGNVRIAGGHFTGRLANEPVHLRKLKKVRPTASGKPRFRIGTSCARG